jgi:ribosomal protein S18 acetylase RimI-like enzyme
MSPAPLIRALIPQDEPTLWLMLQQAAQESSLAAVKANPALAIYVQGWGRNGDIGAVAVQADPKGSPLGAAWLRLWSAYERGYGFIDEAIPELALAVLPDYRNQGIGTALLKETLSLAQPHFSAICLSVRGDNPAVRLYKRLGFEVVPGSTKPNRVGGTSFKMIHHFEQAI